MQAENGYQKAEKNRRKICIRQLKSAIIAYENLRRPRPEKDREEEAGTKRVQRKRKAVAEERKAVAEEREAVAEEREAVAVDQKQTVK